MEERKAPAGNLRQQLEASVSEDTQLNIKAGLLRTQMGGRVTGQLQDRIRAGLGEGDQGSFILEAGEREIRSGQDSEERLKQLVLARQELDDLLVVSAAGKSIAID